MRMENKQIFMPNRGLVLNIEKAENWLGPNENESCLTIFRNLLDLFLLSDERYHVRFAVESVDEFTSF